MAIEIILGVLVVTLLVAAAIVYWLWKKTESPAEYYKIVKNGNSVVRITAHQNLDAVRIADRVGKEKLQFVRTGVKKGEQVEFVYGPSLRPVHIVLEAGGRKEVVHAKVAA